MLCKLVGEYINEALIDLEPTTSLSHLRLEPSTGRRPTVPCLLETPAFSNITE